MDRELYPDHIEHVIAQRLSGTISALDDKRLCDWADSSPQNKLLLESLCDSELMLSRVDKMREFDTDAAWSNVKQTLRRRRLKRVSYAATGVAAAIVIFIIATQYTPSNPTHTAAHNSVAIFVDPSAVKLTVSGGNVFAVDSIRRLELKDVVAQSMPKQMEVTAVSATPILSVAYSTLETPACKTYTVTLEDGSRVTLNAGSSLRFPERFNPLRPREVYLSGEAYFSVSKDPKRPFIVTTRDSYVKVTGTEFNVCCYDDSDTQLTTLISGSVNVGRSRSNTEIQLKAGMQASQQISTGHIDTYAVNTSDYTAWLQDLFAFHEKPLDEIMQNVSRWYSRPVVFENQAHRKISYTGKIPRSSSLEQVIEFFRRTAEIDILLTADKVIIR